MQLRKFSAIAAGAMAVSVLSVPTALMVSPAEAAVAAGVKFTCTVPDFSKSFEWTTDVDITGARVAGAANVTLTATTGDLVGFSIPVDLAGMKNTGSMAVAVNGVAGLLTGSRTADVPASTPVPTPTMTGAIAAAGTSLNVAVTKVDFVANALGSDVEVNCTPLNPIVVSGVAVVTTTPPAPPAPSPPVVAAPVVAKISVGAAVKKKVATLTAKVSGASGSGAGKVSITVKKGKKTVKRGALALKGGKATMKMKKLAKGKYTVTVSYAGNATYQPGAAKKTFKVK